MVDQASGTDVRITTTVLAIVSFAITAFRLKYRKGMRLLWWDDAFALLATICQFILLVALWIRTDMPGVGPLNEPRQARVVAYWLVVMFFTCVLWAARISMLLSIIRVIPTVMCLRRIAWGVLVLFALMWASLIGQKLYLCRHHRAWEQMSVPQCHLGRDVAALELVTDFVSNALLIAMPLRLLARISLPSNQKKLLFIIWSANVLITIVSIVHAAYVLGPSGLLEATAANAEAATALIVCNFSVVATWAYRRFLKGENLDEVSLATTADQKASHALRMIRHSGDRKWEAPVIHVTKTTDFGLETIDIRNESRASVVGLDRDSMADKDHESEFGQSTDTFGVKPEADVLTLPGVLITRETVIARDRDTKYLFRV